MFQFIEPVISIKKISSGVVYYNNPADLWTDWNC